MKKFTFMLIAVFMAVTSFAGVPVHQSVPVAQRQKVTAIRQHTHGRKAVKVANPLARTAAAPLAKKVRKAPRKAISVDELAGRYILASSYCDVNDDGELVEADIAAGGKPITITKTGDNTIAISGFTYDTEEDITATVDVEAGTISIPDGQTLLTSDYGPILLCNVESGSPLTGTIYEDGVIEIDQLWYTVIGGDGEYAGEMWDYYYYYSTIVPVNGKMTWTEEDEEEGTITHNEDIFIFQDSEEPQTVVVYNFGGFETAVTITLKKNQSFVIDNQLVYIDYSDDSMYYSYGLTDDGENTVTLTGKGTDTELVFDYYWTFWASNTGYWFGLQGPATITLTDGTEFIYPTVDIVEGDSFTFDFNSMSVETSSNVSNKGDITEATTIEAGSVTLTISPKTTGSTNNRYWATTNGPQLRVYSGTLTFEAPEGSEIVSLLFNAGKWNDGNSADSGEFGSYDGTEVEWEGSAQSVVVSIAGNSQINSIVVTLSGGSGSSEELVTLPDGAEVETWTIEGTFTTEEGADDVQEATQVAIVGTDIYVQGLAYYFEDAWLKGTIADGEATFPSGQFVGEDEYGKEYMLGSDDGETINDIVFTYDAEAKTLTQKTAYIFENGDSKTEFNFYGYWTDVVLYAGEPVVIDPVTPPTDLATDVYLFKSQVMIPEYDDDGNPIESSFADYESQVIVGFDGDDLYIQGLSVDLPQAWVMATKNEDGKYVIPANQYMGTLAFGGMYEYDYYFTAIDDNDNLIDIVLTLDPETGTITTKQKLALNANKSILNYYMLFDQGVFTKLKEIAAVPADPEIAEVFLTTDEEEYPYIEFYIPTKSVDGEELMKTKLSYQIFFEKDGEEQPLTLTKDLYKNLEEDMTVIPYTFDDDYDIYAGGFVYLNQGNEEVNSWTKIGVKVINTAGGETHESNIVWYDLEDYYEDSIADMAATGQKVQYFDLQGRVASATQKGMLIKQVRQQDGTVKNLKVLNR